VDLREEVQEDGKILIEEHYNMYSSPGIIRMIKSRRADWVVQNGTVEKCRKNYSRKNLKGRDYFADLGVGKGTIKSDLVVSGLDSAGSG
jgi:hypothetical protein